MLRLAASVSSDASNSARLVGLRSSIASGGFHRASSFTAGITARISFSIGFEARKAKQRARSDQRRCRETPSIVSE
eukprot:jgi/Pico_ML_1/55743/g1388.t1